MGGLRPAPCAQPPRPAPPRPTPNPPAAHLAAAGAAGHVGAGHDVQLRGAVRGVGADTVLTLGVHWRAGLGAPGGAREAGAPAAPQPARPSPAPVSAPTPHPAHLVFGIFMNTHALGHLRERNGSGSAAQPGTARALRPLTRSIIRGPSGGLLHPSTAPQPPHATAPPHPRPQTTLGPDFPPVPHPGHLPHEWKGQHLPGSISLFKSNPRGHTGGFSLQRLALHSGETGEVTGKTRVLLGVQAPTASLRHTGPATHSRLDTAPQGPSSPCGCLPQEGGQNVPRGARSETPGPDTAPCPRGRRTAEGDIAAGVGEVHPRDQVRAVLRALSGGPLAALLGLADDAASPLQADAVLAVELKVLPKLQDGQG